MLIEDFISDDEQIDLGRMSLLFSLLKGDGIRRNVATTKFAQMDAADFHSDGFMGSLKRIIREERSRIA